MAQRGVANDCQRQAAGTEGLMRALVLHPSLQSPGGSSCLTAWALQALRDDFAVTLLSWADADVDTLNATYGTRLHAGDFAVELPSRGERGAFAALHGDSGHHLAHPGLPRTCAAVRPGFR